MEYPEYLTTVARLFGCQEKEVDCARLNKLHEREYSPEDAVDVILVEGWLGPEYTEQ